MIQLPARPLRVHPPGIGLGSQIRVVIVSLILLAGMAYLVIPPIGDLQIDRGLVGKARPIPGAGITGHCSVYVVVTRCDATLTAPLATGGSVSRKVDYFFVDFHAGDYQAVVVADPARPGVLSTDLALDKLTNRMITLALLGPALLLAGLAGLAAARRRVGRQRAIVRALANQELRPVWLRMEHYLRGAWTVSGFPPSSPVATQWAVPTGARPIVMDPGQRAVLGITAGDGATAMPLDAGLTWIEITADERRALLAALGPDRVGRWLAALDSPALVAVRRRFQRLTRIYAVMGLVLAVAGVAGGLAADTRILMLLGGGLAVLFLLCALFTHITSRRHAAILTGPGSGFTDTRS